MSNEKDVKQEEPKAEEQAKATNEEAKETAPSAEQEEEELFDSIMGSKENKIPYSRFKEVNDAKKAAEAKAAELEQEISSRVEEAVKQRLIEQQLFNKPQEEEDYSFLDPDSGTKKEVDALKQQIAELSNQLEGVSRYTEENILKQELKNLKAIFPAMNEEHVLAAKKLSPNTSLEEIAKYSNDMFTNHAKKVFNEMVEQKKKAAETAKVVKKEAIKALPPEAKPKTMAEAQKLMMQFVEDD